MSDLLSLINFSLWGSGACQSTGADDSATATVGGSVEPRRGSGGLGMLRHRLLGPRPTHPHLFHVSSTNTPTSVMNPSCIHPFIHPSIRAYLFPTVIHPYIIRQSFLHPSSAHPSKHHSSSNFSTHPSFIHSSFPDLIQFIPGCSPTDITGSQR